jgi:hypothetical protein
MRNFIKKHYWRVIPLAVVGVVYGVGWVFANTGSLLSGVCIASGEIGYGTDCYDTICVPTMTAIPFLIAISVIMFFARRAMWRRWRWFAGVYMAVAIGVIAVSRVAHGGFNPISVNEGQVVASLSSIGLLLISVIWIIIDYIFFFLSSRKKK